MIRRHAIFLTTFCSLFPVLIAIADSSPIDYYQPPNIRKFADYLYAQGDYLRAAGEYQRFLFSQSVALDDDILRRIAESYRLGGRPDHAVQFLKTLLQTQPKSNLVRYELGTIYFLVGQYDESIHLLNESQDLFQREEYRWKSQMLIGMNSLMQKRWESAVQHFDQLGLSGVPEAADHHVSMYKRYAEDGSMLPSKSPLLAGFLSTVLPGSGRVYVGRPNDALLTVFLLGVLGWTAYDGFSENGVSSRKGWALGTLGGIFYLGNIYGSVVAAQTHNRRTEAAFLATIPFEIP
jgi:TM2 domain-containing membrane protein YozV